MALKADSAVGALNCEEFAHALPEVGEALRKPVAVRDLRWQREKRDATGARTQKGVASSSAETSKS